MDTAVMTTASTSEDAAVERSEPLPSLGDVLWAIYEGGMQDHVQAPVETAESGLVQAPVETAESGRFQFGL